MEQNIEENDWDRREEENRTEDRIPFIDGNEENMGKNRREESRRV